MWLLLESGDKAKDDAAARTLEEQTKTMEELLQLPDMTGDPVLMGPGAPDVSALRIDFPVMRVSRTDRAEGFLVAMLVGTEADLKTFDEPIAFPIYGRGRALYAFVGKGINPDTVGQACAFLVGGCSCEIKAGNPGTDLLIRADWERDVGGGALIREIELPPLPGLSTPEAQTAAADSLEESDASASASEAMAVHEQDVAQPAAAALGAPEAEAEGAERDSPRSLWRNVALAIAGAVAVVGIATTFLLRANRE